MKQLVGALVALVTLSACEKLPEGQVSLDGQPLAFASAHGVLSDGTWMVRLFESDQVTCEEALSRSSRELVELGRARGKSNDEINVRLGVDEAGQAAIGTGGNNKLGKDFTITIRSQPSKPGDTLSLYLPEPVEYELQIGSHKGKTLVAHGLFSAHYCGEMAR